MKKFFENHIKVFGKAQVTAGVATASDFLVLTFFMEVVGLFLEASVALGAACGGVINFYLNRKWAFRNEGEVKRQAVRYAMVSGGSLVWNTVLVRLFTDFLSIHYLVAKVMTVVMVGLFWNYLLQRYWVFHHQQVADSV